MKHIRGTDGMRNKGLRNGYVYELSATANGSSAESGIRFEIITAESEQYIITEIDLKLLSKSRQ
jgi:hypothetical protein